MKPIGHTQFRLFLTDCVIIVLEQVYNYMCEYTAFYQHTSTHDSLLFLTTSKITTK